EIGGHDRAKVIQLSMEYDPQPPFDCGHMSKASTKQKAAATALMAREIAKPTQLKAGTRLLWNHAVDAARAKVARR
ncbi:MAG: DJ-1/PfpI family protein, partial [Mycobacterium sp.]